MALAVGAASALAGAAKTTLLVKLGASLVLGAASQAIQRKAAQRSPIGNDSRNEMIRQPITHRRLVYGRVKLSGPITYLYTRFGDRVQDVLLTLSDRPVDGFEAFWVDDTLATVVNRAVQNAPWANVLEFYTGDGRDNGDTSLLYALTQNTGGNWTANHRQRGCAKLYAHLYNPAGYFREGLPKFSTLMRGHRILDPRDESQSYDDPDGWAWSANPPLQIADYLAGYQVVDGGRTEPAGLGCASSEINWDSFVAAANHADEQVELSNGAAEARFAGHGVLESSLTHEDSLTALLSACGATLTFSGGVFHLISAAYKLPSRVISLGELRGPVTVRPRASIRETFNTVLGSYQGPGTNWVATDSRPVSSATAIEEDGEELLQYLELPFTQTETGAQRLARLELERSRLQVTAELPGRFCLLDVMPGDVVTVPIEELGWESKEFEVITSEIGGGDGEDLGVDLLVRETAAEAFDHNVSDEVAAAAAPNTRFPSATSVSPPSSLTIEEDTFVAREGGGVKARVTLGWQASPDAFLLEYRPAYRLTDSEEWIHLSPTRALSARIDDIAPGRYDFRVQALNRIGVLSPALERTSEEIEGLSAPPSALDGLTVSASGGLAYARWNRHPDTDVRVGGTIEFRHSPALTGATWTSSTSLGDPVDGAATSAVFALKRGTILARPRDSSGNYAETDAVFVVAGHTVLEYSTDTTVTEHPGFAGTHSNTTDSAGVLQLAGVGDFDAVTDVDALDNWDFVGGLALSGTYTHANGIDLGSVKAVRLVPHLVAAASLVGDNVDDRAGLVDDWQDWDNTEGTAGAAVDAQIWVRWTEDDPGGGSPTWSEWERLDGAEYVARGFEFQTRLFTKDPAYNELVTELSITAEVLV